MNSYLQFVTKSLSRQKMMAILAGVSIILATTLLTALGLSYSLMKDAMIQQAQEVGGHDHAVITNLGRSTAEQIRHEPLVNNAGLSLTLGAFKLPGGGINVTIEGFDSEVRSMQNVQLLEGRFPTKENEIALEQAVLKQMGITGEIGQKITLDISSIKGTPGPELRQTITFTLSGILKNSIGTNASNIGLGLASPDAAVKLLPADYQKYSIFIRVADGHNPEQVISDIARKYEISKNQILYNDMLMAAQGYNGGSIRDSSLGWILTGGLVLLAACLVIYNVFHISMLRRIPQFGMLRAIGAEPRQIRSLVLGEAFLLCIIAIPLGMLAGAGFAEWLSQMIAGLFNPDMLGVSSAKEAQEVIRNYHSLSYWPFVLAGCISLTATLLSVLVPSRRASRVSPTVAITGRAAVSIPVRRKRTAHNVARIRHFVSYMARLNLKRNPGRTFTTMLSLFMGIVVFVSIHSFSMSLSGTAKADQLLEGDYDLFVNQDNKQAGFSEQDITSIEDLSGIKEVRTAQYQRAEKGDVQIKGAPVLSTNEVFGYNLSMLSKLKEFTLQGPFDEAALKQGTGVIAINPISSIEEMQLPSLKVGDKISVHGKEVTVVGVAAQHAYQRTYDLLGYDVIMPSAVYRELYGRSDVQAVQLFVDPQADRHSIETVLGTIKDKVPSSTLVSHEEAQVQVANTKRQMNILAWEFIGFVGLIGALNIFNTNYTNIHTRTVEFGTMQAIGMEKRQLFSMIIWEGLLYGLVAALIGVVAGSGISYFLHSINGDLASWRLPLVEIVWSFIGAIAICLVSTSLPLRKVNRMSSIDNLRAID
ncbi:FtsX-like permease family protein [Paenibacillus durus]|uniref:ABC transporter permease n=1 Tax=Paenibacillus durus ATCC 35681 TaxID=1333534 RepID=A0A0F7CIU7_PAEDU|nr:ABC transporter permease [Paenibacillus durus]AKG34955.1 hypothetical protein VK70_10580 [Paenibacillus durus ATCC 35681]